MLYTLQSLAVSALLLSEGLYRNLWGLLVIALIVFLLKVILAPLFFNRFVRKSQMNLLTSTYLSTPLTLVSIILVIFFCNSDVITPLKSYLSVNESVAQMLFASMFSSMFILINRKGSLSQIIGMLSLENSIVAFGFFLGTTQTLMVEIGIIFDLFVWIVLASIFVEYIYRNLRTIDVTTLNKLNE
jgi:hydrogenase-4 component E